MGQERPFGLELRRLRTERGISLAGLSSRTHYSKGYLSKIETGAKPASAELAGHLDEALGTGGNLVRLISAIRLPVCPYRGLSAFGSTDAAWFFGREQTTAELLEGMTRALDNGKPVALVGPSGVGKSSLLRAGLLPALTRDALPGSAGWPVLVMTPTATPGSEFSKQARRLPDTEADRMVVVVDQFEEVFTLCESEAERTAFITALSAIASTPRALVVLGLRADFYDRCLSYPQLLGALRGNQITVGPMSVSQLRAVISQPAEAAGLRLEPGLVELLLADAGASEHGVGGSGALPLLSHALLATWQERDGTTLTVAGYRRTGGIANAVAETADRAYNSLGPTARQAARRLLLRLVRVGEHEQDTRRPAEREPLLRQLPDQADTEAAMQVLAAARLLTVDASTVTITHEALLHAWPRLHGWLDSDRSGLRVHQQLTEAAEGWDSDGRHPSLLQRGPRLELAEDWAREHDRLLSGLEREFLVASRAQEDSARLRDRRHTRRLRLLVAGLAVLTLLAGAATTIAVRQGDATVRQRDVAISKALATEANQLSLTDPALAAQLSLAAYRVADTPEARGSLLTSSGTTHATQLKAHTASLTDLTFTPDGRTLITTGEDGATRLWDVTSPGRPVARATITGHARFVTAVAVTSQGGLLATADEADATRLWKIDVPGAPVAAGVLPGTGQSFALAFSHDGTLLAIARQDGGVGLWNVADPSRPLALGTLTGHTRTVRSLAFAPNAPILVTGSDDYTSRLWDLATPRAPVMLATLSTHEATIRAVAFSPDGRTVATGSDDHTAELWTMADPHHPVRSSVLSGHVNAIWGITFSEDGSTIATASDDQTVRLWNAADATAIASFPQPVPARRAAFAAGGRILATGNDVGGVWIWHLPPPVIANSGGATAVAYDPHRPELAIGGADGHVRLWNADPNDRRTEAGDITNGAAAVRALSYDPRGGVLAIAGDERPARLWDISRPGTPATLATLDVTGEAVAFSPDGRVLAVAEKDWTLQLWDTTNPSRPVLAGVLKGHQNLTRGLAFSPDGHLLATASNDYSTRLWDVRNPRAPVGVAMLTDHSNAVSGVAFSPDGHLLATASEDHTVNLLDVTNPARPTTVAALTGHAGPIDAVAFSPDGRTLATAADDRTVRLWDVANPARPTTLASLTGHTGAVTGVAFSPDGRTLATAADDRTVRLWATDPTEVVQRICEFAGPPLSPEQWSTYVTDLPYRQVCP